MSQMVDEICDDCRLVQQVRHGQEPHHLGPWCGAVSGASASEMSCRVRGGGPGQASREALQGIPSPWSPTTTLFSSTEFDQTWRVSIGAHALIRWVRVSSILDDLPSVCMQLSEWSAVATCIWLDSKIHATERGEATNHHIIVFWMLFVVSRRA